MHLPADLVTWLKLVGTVSSGVGSFLLAWRVKSILQWVVYSIVAHEVSISQLLKVANRQPQTMPIIEGVPHQLLDIQDKVGLILLVLGFLLLGAGMLCTAATYVLKVQ